MTPLDIPHRFRRDSIEGSLAAVLTSYEEAMKNMHRATIEASNLRRQNRELLSQIAELEEIVSTLVAKDEQVTNQAAVLAAGLGG